MLCNLPTTMEFALIVFMVLTLVVDIQAYNYGYEAAPNAGSASGTYCIQAATFAYSQVQSIGLNAITGIPLCYTGSPNPQR